MAKKQPELLEQPKPPAMEKRLEQLLEEAEEAVKTLEDFFKKGEQAE